VDPQRPAGESAIARAADLPASGVHEALRTRPRGLTRAEAEERQRACGPNRLERVPRRSSLRALPSHFTHLMAILLWAGGLAAFFARMPQLGIAIWLVNVVNGVFSFWQEHKAERAMEALLRLLPTWALVLRDGEETRIDAEALVPGDVLVLHAGARVSADARADQSSLTGESRPVRKSAEPHAGGDPVDAPCLVFAGTTVLSGSGRAVVFATGMSTAFGRIARLTQAVVQELSPLQREMISLTRVVTAIAVGCGAVFFFLALAEARGAAVRLRAEADDHGARGRRRRRRAAGGLREGGAGRGARSLRRDARPGRRPPAHGGGAR